MSDKGRIIVGLLIFIVVVTAPIWYDLASGVDREPPEIVLPAGETQCVADAAYMRTEHMQLLMDWREEVVRQDDREFVTADGRHFEKSLTGTCLGCHDNKAEFCDRCHDYLSVKPYCWDCHVVPKGGQ